MNMKKSFIGQVVAISVYAFALSFLWNTLNPLILPYIIARLEPEFKNTLLGLITAVGLVVAIVVQPLAGGISDRSRFRWGKRRPFILVGTLADLVFLAMMALTGSYWVLFLAYCLLQTSSNVAHGPYQGFIPDLMPEEKRGLASGAKNLVELLALIIGSAIIGLLLGQNQPLLAFIVIGLVLAATVLITMLYVREQPASGAPSSVAVPRLSLSAVGMAVQRHSVFAWYVLSRFMILAGLGSVRTFAQNYIQDVLLADNPAALAGRLMTILGVAVLVVVLPAGHLADAIGRKRLNLIAVAIGFVGTILMMRAGSFNDLVVYGAVVGVGVGIFLSANWALAMDLIPAAEAALFLGLTNLATAGSGAVAGMLGPLIDMANRAAPGQGYNALFVLAALLWLLGGVIIARLPLRR